MFNSYTTNLNAATIGFCISEKNGIYVANNFITGLRYHCVQCRNIITLYTINQQFDIYEHNDKYINFNIISNKIITRIVESIRYNIAVNIDIDKIIDEVIKDV